MKRIIFLLLFITSLAYSQSNSLDVFLTIKRFYEPQQERNYVELSFLIPGNVVSYKEIEANKFQGQVLIAIDIKNKKEEIIFNHVYKINSPIYSDNPSSLVNLSDLINIPIEEDSILFVIQALDLNDSTLYFKDQLEITNLEKKDALLSDITLISQKSTGSEADLFYKNGQILTPKFLNFYPSESNKLGFYIEAYNKNIEKNYLLKYFISDENNVVLDKYSNYKKLQNRNVEALYSEFDISKLPSGNFYLYVELRNVENSLIDRKRMYFQRSNMNEVEVDKVDYYELDVIHDNFAKKYDLRNITHHLNALRPIANDWEKAAIEGAIKANDLENLQNYFYSFWSKRDRKNPEDRWKEYAEKLQFVEAEFGNSMIEGHETSRGRVYLQYGKPFERLERNTPQYGLIELWTYEQIDKQGAVKFLFRQSDLYDDEYQLVHSSLNNEIFSRDWDKIIKTNNF